MDKAIILPGDKIFTDPSSVTIGPGLRVASNEKQSILATNCGVLRKRVGDDGDQPTAIWIDYDNRRYIPVIGDHVIGQVMQKTGMEGWKVDIGCADLAQLSSLSFEGATKRNRPDVVIGDLVYGLVTETVEPEIACISEDRRARSFCVLPRDGGYLVRSTPTHVRKLLSPQCELLKLLGTKHPFEVTCGMNGWVWVKARTLRETVHIVGVIEASRRVTNEQMRDLVQRLEEEFRGQFVYE